MTTRELLLTAWQPGIVVPLVSVVALAAYAYRFRVQGRSAFFMVAVALFFIALASPIGVLARGYLFSAHMLQHLLLMLAVPPLVLLGLPREPDAAPKQRSTTAVALPWLAGLAPMWIWHAPALCNAAAVSASIQWLQTVSLVAMGLLFWFPVLAPRLSDRLPVFTGVLYLFAACVGCTILGILVTLSPVDVCSVYTHPVDSLGVVPLLRDGWGLSCRADQELGGLMMWVPACLVYASAILAALGRYFAGERRAHHALGGAE